MDLNQERSGLHVRRYPSEDDHPIKISLLDIRLEALEGFTSRLILTSLQRQRTLPLFELPSCPHATNQGQTIKRARLLIPDLSRPLFQ